MTTLEFYDRRRLIRSSLIAAAFWLVLVAALSLISFVAPVKEVRQFKSVKLTLAAPAPAVLPAASAVRSGVSSVPAVPAAGLASAAGQKVPGSPASKKPGAVSPKSAAAKSAGGLGIPNFSSPPSSGSTRPTSGSVSGNSLDFASSGDQSASVAAQAPKGANAVVEFEGAAASVVSPASRGTGKTVRSGGSGGASGAAASGDTSASLGDIAAAAKSGSFGGSGSAGGQGAKLGTGGSSGGQGGAGSGTGSVSSGPVSGFSFDGASRKLLYPAKPAIVLPDNLAKLVDSSRAVTVSFTVLADGSVPAGTISFTPSAILPAEIRDWLRKEFSSWRFEKSSEDGQARFLYSIRVE